MIYGVSDKMSLQGPGLLEEIESYTSGFGTKHFYIIDVFFFDTWTQKLAEIYENSKSTFQSAVFEGEVTRSKIREFQEQAVGSDIDTVIAIGGCGESNRGGSGVFAGSLPDDRVYRCADQCNVHLV